MSDMFEKDWRERETDQIGGVIVCDEGADQVAPVGGDDAHLFWGRGKRY